MAFKNHFPKHSVSTLDLNSSRIRESIPRVLELWQRCKRKSDDDVAIEFAAIERCFGHLRHDNLFSLGLFLEDTIIGFCVLELIHDGFVMGHFLKTDPEYEHASDVLLAEAMKASDARGYRHFNCQQDLGVPGLRTWKQSWRPTGLLRKYSVARRQICELPQPSA
jgi:uncharacterized protein